MAKAILLQAGVGGDVIPVDVNGYKEIQDKVGGLFDVVRQQVNDDIVAVGYVHDEGLLLDLDMNWVASALFMREIRGDVVVVNGYSPNGEYDGDDYDLPQAFIEYMKTTFLARVAEKYNESVMVTAILEQAIEMGIMTDGEVDEWLNELSRIGEEHDRAGFDKLQDKLKEIITKIKEEESAQATDELIDEIYDFLKEQK